MRKVIFILVAVFIFMFLFSSITLAAPTDTGTRPSIDPFGIFDESQTTDTKIESWFKTIAGKGSSYALMTAFLGVIILSLLMSLPLGQRMGEWLKSYGFKIVGSVALLGAGLFVIKWAYGLFSIV